MDKSFQLWSYKFSCSLFFLFLWFCALIICTASCCSCRRQQAKKLVNMQHQVQLKIFSDEQTIIKYNPQLLLLARPSCVELCTRNLAKGETGVSEIVCDGETSLPVVMSSIQFSYMAQRSSGMCNEFNLVLLLVQTLFSMFNRIYRTMHTVTLFTILIQFH